MNKNNNNPFKYAIIFTQKKNIQLFIQVEIDLYNIQFSFYVARLEG